MLLLWDLNVALSSVRQRKNIWNWGRFSLHPSTEFTALLKTLNVSIRGKEGSVISKTH